MGHLLVDVLNLEDEGLVGYTENGEQIALKATLDISIKNVPSDKHEEEMQKYLKCHGDETYIMFENKSDTALDYQTYSKRK